MYLKKSVDERRKFLAEKELCYSCYMPGHRSRGCSRKRTCKTCSRRHPTGLHVYNFKPTSQKSENATCDKSTETSAATMATIAAHTSLKETQDFVGSLPIVPVILRSSEAELITYAMLDNCSTGTFILEEFQHKLKVDGINSQVLVKTMNGHQLHNAKVIRGLTISDLDGNNSILSPDQS